MAKHSIGYESQFIPTWYWTPPTSNLCLRIPISLGDVFSELCCDQDSSNPVLPLLSSFTGVKSVLTSKGSPAPSYSFPLYPLQTFSKINPLYIYFPCWSSVSPGTWTDIDLSTSLMWYGTSVENLGSYALEKLLDKYTRRHYAVMFSTA